MCDSVVDGSSRMISLLAGVTSARMMQKKHTAAIFA